MPFSDLRQYLQKQSTETWQEFTEKSILVASWVRSVRPLTKRAEKALYFERVRGSSMPVVTELLYHQAHCNGIGDRREVTVR